MNAPPFENSTMEEVSDITGTAIPAFYELRKMGTCTLVECIESKIVRKPDILKDIHEGRYKLPKTIAKRPKTSEDFLFWANVWLSLNSGYVGRLTQINRYHWFPEAAMEQCVERLDDTMLRINMKPTEYERSIDTGVQPETMGFRLCGRADIIDQENMMEFKAVYELRREHYLHTALYMYMMQSKGELKPRNFLYNVLSDECVLVECDCLPKLVECLFRSKYSTSQPLCDRQFLLQ
jgi:hypothetical protein